MTTQEVDKLIEEFETADRQATDGMWSMAMKVAEPSGGFRVVLQLGDVPALASEVFPDGDPDERAEDLLYGAQLVILSRQVAAVLADEVRRLRAELVRFTTHEG